jgi:hypothetical protein
MKSFQLPTGHSARRTQYAGTSRSARGTVKHRLATMTPLGYYCGDGYSCRIRQDQSHTVFDIPPSKTGTVLGARHIMPDEPSRLLHALRAAYR